MNDPNDDVLEIIADACWNGGSATVKIYQKHAINAANNIYSGTVFYNGVTYGFNIESGDMNGTVVHEWGLEDDVGIYDPGPPLEQRTFIPRVIDPAKLSVLKIYACWIKEPWFKEKVNAYNYDRHFQPGSYIENHYKEWANKKGMVVGYLSDIPSWAREEIGI